MALQTKRGGPYTKQEQQKRRDNVFKLHFEYGYSAVQISEMLKVNRNTINGDISFLYSQLAEERDKISNDRLLNKQILRIESQRARLRKELDGDITLQEKLRIEKMIFELDMKFASLFVKLDSTRQFTRDVVVTFINNWMKEKGYKDRYLSVDSLYRIPEKNRKKIYELLKEK